jgi:hypothetical protein
MSFHPGPRRFDDVVDLLVFGPPPQIRGDSLGTRDEHRGVAGPPVGHAHGNRATALGESGTCTRRPGEFEAQRPWCRRPPGDGTAASASDEARRRSPRGVADHPWSGRRAARAGGSRIGRECGGRDDQAVHRSGRERSPFTALWKGWKTEDQLPPGGTQTLETEP